VFKKKSLFSITLIVIFDVVDFANVFLFFQIFLCTDFRKGIEGNSEFRELLFSDPFYRLGEIMQLSVVLARLVFKFSQHGFYKQLVDYCLTLLQIHLSCGTVKSVGKWLNLSTMKSEMMSDNSSAAFSSKMVSTTSSFFCFE
jgi:hypothetical protein